ncbi:MAG TPA: 3-oxoacyl-ACP reductase FabG [Bryobacteraceae bacterium]|nr:3-oxoacyl-ACP reductase FabG [Bryobacteraceae bacterium]
MIDTGLAGKVVVVTGGASGIGRATADQFVGEGCHVCVWDVREPDSEAFFFQRVDVTDTVSIQAATDAVVARHGRIDVLVNNAGILRDARLVTTTDEAFDAVIAVNLRGVFACTRAVATVMTAQRSGVILNASSVVGLYGNFGQTNYVASKSAVIGMTRTWARELGKYGIRVNAVTPGFIATEMIQAMPEKVLQGMREHTPLGRVGEPADIANAYVWLASDQASFVHGAVIPVDGGIVVGT